MLNFVFRFAMVLLGCAGIAWGMWRFDLARQETGLESMAAAVLSGDDISDDDIVAMLKRSETLAAERFCYLDVLRSRVILGLRLAESALTKFDTVTVEYRFRDLKDKVRAFQSCFDGDGFVDLAAYWISINENGDVDAALPSLRKSFEHAPGEGWVIVKRVWLAFGIYGQLPDDLRKRLLNDVVRMNDARLISETGALLVQLPQPVRSEVISYLKANHKTSLLDLRDVVQKRGKFGDEFD